MPDDVLAERVSASIAQASVTQITMNLQSHHHLPPQGGCHDDGLTDDPVGNDRLHPVGHRDCAAGRVAAVFLIVPNVAYIGLGRSISV
jgi:hypothetical protein